MRKYCAEAAEFGNVTEPTETRLKKVLIILNPTANRRSAQKSVSSSFENANHITLIVKLLLQFDEYCAPILHLAGMAIEILQTDSEGHARRHLEDPETALPHAILVAGGDGTLSETITGLLRRGGSPTPIGVLPCGRTNSLAQQLFGYSSASTLHEVEGLARASIAIVRGRHTATDVIKIEPLVDATSDADTAVGAQSQRPIFAVGSVQWGAFRDALQLRDKYWYFGPWRDYCAYLFNAFGQRLTWQCVAELTYTPPCAGCNNCWTYSPATAASVASAVAKPAAGRRWWSGYSAPKGGNGGGSASKVATPTVDYTRVLNPACGQAEQLAVRPHELVLSNNAARRSDELPRLSVRLHGHGLSGVDFVKEGWSRIRGDGESPAAEREFEVRVIEIRPAPEVLHSEEREAFFSIDNEAYEVKPVRVSVVPQAVRMFKE